MKTYLVTGAAGFIGSHVATRLLDEGHRVAGIDNISPYYDIRLKKWRLDQLASRKNFSFKKMDVADKPGLQSVFQAHKFDAVLNLAACAGVRYSMEHPHDFFMTNTVGTMNLLECCKEHKIKKFLLSSTASLYAGERMPFKETAPANTPLSPYAASKKGAEAACHAWHYLYGIDVSVVRYFTVYGPAGRPDMSLFIFTKKILEGTPIPVFGDGTQRRNFTYIDDIVDGTCRALRPSASGCELYNLGGSKHYKLTDAISLIEKHLNKKARIVYKKFHKADIKDAWADVSKAKKMLGWSPTVDLDEGLRRMTAWFVDNRKWLKIIK